MKGFPQEAEAFSTRTLRHQPRLARGWSGVILRDSRHVQAEAICKTLAQIMPISRVSGSSTMRLREPSPSRSLSTREQIILLESSRLHGSRFPPWQNPPGMAEFELGVDQTMFTYAGNSTVIDHLSYHSI